MEAGACGFNRLADACDLKREAPPVELMPEGRNFDGNAMLDQSPSGKVGLPR
jgi:hypothetical protein